MHGVGVTAEPIRLDRRQQRRLETIEEIVDVAVEVMTEYGVAGLSLGEVARRMGMRTPSLYTYFEAKSAVYDAVFARGWQAVHEAMLPVYADLDEVDDRRFAVHRHRRHHHPKSAADVMLARPRERESVDARELPRIDRFGRAHERSAPAGLHLDEDVAAAIAADEIELAIPGAGVAGDDPHARALERAGRGGLTEITEHAAGVGHA